MSAPSAAALRAAGINPAACSPTVARALGLREQTPEEMGREAVRNALRRRSALAALRAGGAPMVTERAIGPQAPVVGPRAASDAGGLVLTLPWACVVPDNARLGVLGGRALLSRRYRTDKEAARLVLAAQYRARAPLAGAVRLEVALHLPDRRRRDTLNVGKLLGDALEAAGVLADDTQIADARLYRAGLDRAAPRVVLTLTPIGELRP